MRSLYTYGNVCTLLLGKTTTMLFKLLQFEEARRQSLFEGGSGQIRQVFLTQSHVLASKVEEYYHQLSNAVQLGAESGANARTKVAERHLTELEEGADHRSDLPEKYSDLTDKHFPLFLTYDQVRDAHLCMWLILKSRSSYDVCSKANTEFNGIVHHLGKRRHESIGRGLWGQTCWIWSLMTLPTGRSMSVALIVVP